MQEKYKKSRPHIPAHIERQIKIEAGHKCTVKNCNEHTYLYIHHIDENRENNNLDNLILLCDKHHKMAHAKKIDRKSLKEYKRLLKVNIHNNYDIKRNRDIENIKKILFVMPINIIDEMIYDLPRYLRKHQVNFFDFFNETFKKPDFFLYDEELFSLLKNIHLTWQCCVACGQQYRHGNSETYFFSNFGDAPLTAEQKIEWNKIEDSRALLKQNLNKFIYKVRNDYLEIDIEAINQNGIDEYIKIQQEICKHE